MLKSNCPIAIIIYRYRLCSLLITARCKKTGRDIRKNKLRSKRIYSLKKLVSSSRNFWSALYHRINSMKLPIYQKPTCSTRREVYATLKESGERPFCSVATSVNWLFQRIKLLRAKSASQLEIFYVGWAARKNIRRNQRAMERRILAKFVWRRSKIVWYIDWKF